MELTPFWFGLYKLLKYLVFPYTWLVIIIAWQLILLRKGAATRLTAIRILAVAAFVIVAVLGNPLIWHSLVGPLEAQYRPFQASSASRPFEAIVVLAGGAVPQGTLRPGDDLYDESRSRTVCGARQFKAGVARRLVLSGGDASIFGSGPNEAMVMKTLAVDLGVPEEAIVLETRSRTTYENAVETRRILGSGPVLLVTSAIHMPRSMALFTKQELSPTAAPCTYVTRDYPPDWSQTTPFDVIPTVQSLYGTTLVLNELVGTWLYKAAGKL